MQGLCDGYFVVPYTIGDYLASQAFTPVETSHDAFAQSETEVTDQITKLLSIQGKKTVRDYHRELGFLMWDHVGMARNEAGLTKALDEIPKLREDFWENLTVPGRADQLNKNLEMAGRLADFLELGELMARDALDRSESCGGHFREESQTDEGEALRKDDEFSYTAAWEYGNNGQGPTLHREELAFENVKLTQRSYK